MKEWWNNLSSRERNLMLVAFASLLFASIYWGLFQPLSNKSERAENRLQREQKLLVWVESKADAIIELRRSNQQSVNSRFKPLNQVIPTSSKQFNIELIRMQPREDKVQVWIKPVPFSALMQWLAFIKESEGVEVEFLDIKRTDTKGVVELSRLQLGRG
ncbi:MAG: type II secretion system protein M [Aliivibrio sp.]|uniref:type II secretion system protein GspM n=1 Tax=Aliivibrio sp. TaxID=1872443 RepID=UPI001A425AE0|nr:type II secretion system protein M [Aliivibrio sp.]